MIPIVSRTLLFLSLCAAASAAPPVPEHEGVHIAAGTLGDFTIKYPELLDGAQKTAHKLIEAKTNGSAATVRYDGGAVLTLTCAADEVRYAFANLPADVKTLKLSMLIDISFGKGGNWKIGAGEGVFPASKPAKPHLFQGNAQSIELTNPQGQKLSFALPVGAYQQLTDNREWNWPIYHWMANIPRQGEAGAFVLKVATELNSSVKVADAFGQPVKGNRMDRVSTVEELKADVAAEKAYYDALKPPVRDPFGGEPGSGEARGLKKTGFFHMEEKQGRQWLVDPAGNAFFHLGICSFQPGEDYTYITGREDIYEWLPKPEGEFATAFRAGDTTSFSHHLANMMRKYGEPYDADRYTARMIDRVRKWGFNSGGAFSSAPTPAHREKSFPYVASLPISEWNGVPRLPGAFEVWDPFDPATRERIEVNITKEVPKLAADPLLIGWFIVNEPRYDQLKEALPALPGKHAAKKRLAAFLSDRHGKIEAYNAAWQDSAKSFAELEGRGLAVKTDAARADVDAFVNIFLEEYFAQIESAYRKHDANHLLIGARLQPVTMNNEALCRIMGKHVDVVSYNYYTYGVDLAALKLFHEWTGKKPMILSEFYWSSPSDSGLLGGREVSSQQQRGLAYRNYVEQTAALPFVVGIEWFTLIDQSLTGRWFSKYSGESGNTGLISVTDRPWKPMLEEMMKTNYTVYDVLTGKRAPFVWEDMKFKAVK